MVSIGTDISALILQHTLGDTTSGLNSAINCMTTGYRINSAKDDAAGYYMATELETKISSWLVAKDNTENSISLLDTAEGGLNNITKLLQRLRDLSVEASNGVYGDSERNAMQAEADELIAQIKQIKENTDYNGLKVLGQNSKDEGVVVTAFARTVSMKNSLIPLSTATVSVDGNKINSNSSSISNNLYSNIDTLVSNI